MRYILVFFFFIITFLIQAQQDPGYTQYVYNLSVVNPAYAGSKDVLSLGFLARKQWVGVTGAPATFTAFAHSPVGKNVGLGVSVISDKIGPINETNIYGDFSYTIQTAEDAKLAFGLKVGFTLLDINALSLTQLDPKDPLFNENINENNFNMGFGMFYYNDKNYLGFSIPNLLKTRHFKRSNNVITEVSDDMHVFITGGSIFNINRELKFKPSFMTKFAYQAPLSVDISANLLYQEKIEVGASYRWGDSVGCLLNFKVNDTMKIGYAYDYTTSNLSVFSSGTHEVMLLFNLPDRSRRYTSLRFF
jgi:type IX secretion system PorP/SprF family membrane protein